MELKFDKAEKAAKAAEGSNRTFMELKWDTAPEDKGVKVF